MHLGYVGIISLMVLSPFPPEVFMPLAGFLVAQGKLEFGGAVVSGVIGFLISVLPWYLAGRFLDEKRLRRLMRHRWVPLSPQSIERGNRWFQQHGGKAVLLGLFLPGVRNMLALPAGLSKMPVLTFLIYATAGALVWLSGLIGLGYYLGDRYTLVESHLGSVYSVVWIVLTLSGAIWVASRYWHRHRRRLSRPD